MSNVLGIVCEYNPFHNGHLHHLNESKKITHSDYSIAIMTGNFTQRGDVSIIDKWSKTRMAIESGVDLVIELPTLYAISSAENFANGAIKLLDSLKIVDYLSFGSECEDISVLNDIANVLCAEPDEYKTLLSHELSRGVSFPKAREKALFPYNFLYFVWLPSIFPPYIACFCDIQIVIIPSRDSCRQQRSFLLFGQFMD